jgi:hypothetical protein
MRHPEVLDVGGIHSIDTAGVTEDPAKFLPVTFTLLWVWVDRHA